MKCPQCRTDNPETARFCLDCGTKLDEAGPGQYAGYPPRPAGRLSLTKTLETSTDELARGTLFAGRYEVIEELGQGGMGRVYRVHDTKLNEEVALKLIRPEFGADKRTAERFRNELKTARKIRHKSVCGMYDFHEDGRTLYLTMEYVRGEDLKSFLKRAKLLSVGTSVLIARQVAEGLAEAHKLGIVHRDLKPGNIMIDKDGQAKIMDFGIARAVWEKDLTGAGAIVGTPEYMSPEQVEGREADRRADIYALGVLLFEMVTGQTPFEGDSPLSIAHKHRYEPPPVPKKLVPQMPESLNKLILRCLEKDKAKRYQTAEELAADLSGIEAVLPSTERATPRLPSRTRLRPSKTLTVTLRPKRMLAIAGGLIVLAAAGFIIWRTVVHPPIPSAKPALAFLSFSNKSGDRAWDSLKDLFPFLLTSGLQQSRYLVMRDQVQVYGVLKRLKLTDAEKFTPEDLKSIGVEGGATHLLSADCLKAGGKFIVSLSLIDAGTGTVLAPLQEFVQNDQDAIYRCVDSLVKKVKTVLDIPEQAIDERDYKLVGEVYTKNPRALQYYVDAARADQVFDYDKVIEDCDKAIELDPNFAMAYFMLGKTYGNRRDYFLSYRNLNKAYQLRDGLPELDRLIAEGSFFLLKERTVPRAAVVLRKAVKRYPDNVPARFSLAFAYGYVDDDLGIEQYRSLIYGPFQARTFKAYYQMTFAYCGDHDYSRARQCWEMMVNENPPDAGAIAALGDLFLLEKNPDAALREYEKAAALAPHEPLLNLYIAYYHFFKDDLKKFREILDGLRGTIKDPTALDEDYFRLDLLKGRFRPALDRVRGWESKDEAVDPLPFKMFGTLMDRVKLYLQTGEPLRALEKANKALALEKKEEDRVGDTGFVNLTHNRRAGMLWEVCALCDAGRIAEAEAIARELEGLIPGFMKKNRTQCICCLSEFARGRIALAKGHFAEAVRQLEAGWRVHQGEFIFEESDHAFFMDMLAEAYQKCGRLDKAAETYACIRELVFGRSRWGPVYARSYYKLGRVYEQMGKKDEARKEYAKFLELWKDADPDLPEVGDAKKRLAAL